MDPGDETPAPHSSCCNHNFHSHRDTFSPALFSVDALAAVVRDNSDESGYKSTNFTRRGIIHDARIRALCGPVAQLVRAGDSS